MTTWSPSGSRLKGQIDREQDRLDREAERAQMAANAQASKNATDLAAEQAKRTQPGEHRLTEPDQPTRATPPTQKKIDGITIPATVRTLHIKNFKGERRVLVAGGKEVTLSPEQRAYRFGLWGMAMLATQLPGRFAYAPGFKSALQFYEENWTPDVLTVAHGSNDAFGTHFLIPEEFSRDMIDLRELFGIARRLLRMESMNSDTKKIPRRRGGLTATFVGENQAGSESNKNWDDVTLTARDLMAIARYSNQVSQDAVINFGDDLAGEICYAFSFKEDDCAFNGAGLSTHGGIVGIRTKLQDVDGAGADSFGLITGAGNAYSELVLTDFHKVVGVLPQYADTPQACWIAHRKFYYEVMEKLALAVGGTTAREIREGQRSGRPIFLGYPVEFSQAYPSTEANSQVCTTLGDYSKGAAFGDRMQEAISFSEHASVGGQSLWERNQIGIKGTQRFDIIVHDVGTASEAGPIVGLQTAAA